MPGVASLALYHGLVVGSLSLLGLLMLLGLGLQLGWRRTSARWPHHALYFAVTVGTLAAGLLAVWSGRVWWPYLPLLGLLLGMSRTRAGKPGHWQLAVAVALAWVGSAALCW